MAGSIEDLLRGNWDRPLDAPLARLTPVTQVRGTLLVTSRDQLRASGHFEAYEAVLPQGAREELASVIAMSWVPVALASAHFEAADALGLPDDEIERNARRSLSRLQSVVFITLGRAAHAVGVTPMSMLTKAGMMWSKIFVGGGYAMRRGGPQEVQCVVARDPLLASRYHRIGMRIQGAVALGLLVRQCVTREDLFDPATNTVAFSIQWA